MYIKRYRASDASAIIWFRKLKSYFESDMILVTDHAAHRFQERGIKTKDIRAAVCQGEIIEQYPDDMPFPSCLILGKDGSGRYLHICMSDEGSSGSIITAYYPDPEKWNDTLTKRKQQS